MKSTTKTLISLIAFITLFLLPIFLAKFFITQLMGLIFIGISNI